MGQPAFTWSRGWSVWWGGKDSNLGSRWQQIYSLPPLSTRVPPHRTPYSFRENVHAAEIMTMSLMTLSTNERQKSRIMQNEMTLSQLAHGFYVVYWVVMDSIIMNIRHIVKMV